MTEIIVALIGLVGVLTSSYYGWQKTKAQKHRAEQAESEVQFQKAALDFGGFMDEWAGTQEEIQKLLEDTPLDRFMMLRAWNGKLAPRWTTAVLQMRLGAQEPVSYVHFELDNDYVSRLKEISIRNVIAFRTEDIPDSVIKKVYEAEGVKYSIWCHIDSEVIPGSNTVSHTYCSFATHQDIEEDPNLVTKCSILAGRLKGVAMSFKSRS